MPKTVHVHIHATRDSWEENKHPRAENGEFGSGGGGGRGKSSAKSHLSEFEGSSAKENKSPEYKSALGAANKEAWEKRYGNKPGVKQAMIRLKNRMAGGAGGRERPKESYSHHQENYAFHSKQAGKLRAETESGKKKGWPASSLPDQKLLQHHQSEANKHAAGMAAWKKYEES